MSINEHTLWTCEDIANHMQRAPRTVYRRVITQPDFPKPVRKLGDMKIRPLFYALEVLKWIKNQQEAA